MSTFGRSIAALLVAISLTMATDQSTVVQDFENPFELEKWPPDHPGSITFSTEWRTSGDRSLRIDAGLMAALSEFEQRDWRGYSHLRFRVRNPTGSSYRVGFEIQDGHTQYYDRHQNSFGVPQGSHTIEMPLSSKLWRGEQNRPYRGSVKTPVDLSGITRLSFFNHGDGPLFIDQIELVSMPPLAVPGGHAFDFGPGLAPVMTHTLAVSEDSLYTDDRGYGLLAAGRVLGKFMSYPTPLLGDGVSWPAEGFRVDLPAGDYLGWIAFERGGFWGGEYSGYASAALLHNDGVVDTHTFTRDGMHFRFQDVEVTDMTQLAEKLIWPAHAIRTFRFAAVEGANVFRLEVTDPTHAGLRVAGLILGPASESGRAFLAAHEKQQRETLVRTFTTQDRGRRDGDHSPPPAGDLIVQSLPPGHVMYPRDWPAKPLRGDVEEILAVAGQQVTVHLGVFASQRLELTASGSAPEGPAVLPAPELAHGRYLPMRPYGTGAAWLEVNHYRPQPQFDVGPELSRSLIAEFDVPADARGGTYTSAITLSGDGMRKKIKVEIRVIPVALEPIPIPVGLFMNALPIRPDLLDEATWWRLQESLLAEQGRAGLNCLTGGPGLAYEVRSPPDGDIEVSGDSAARYIRLAARFGPIAAVVPYGGFLPHLRRLEVDPGLLAKAIRTLEAQHDLPPHYVYAYDEPSTAEELEEVLSWLEPTAGSGLRTIGYTSWNGGESWDDEPWEQLVAASYAPALNQHNTEQLRDLEARGLQPWVYNNGLDRLGMGLRLWRSLRLGAAGRLQWIGLFTQGFAFYNLDGREPSRSCFLVHRELGVLKTPVWLAAREGLLDLRIRLTLEKRAAADDPVLKLWPLAGYRQDEEMWSDERLNDARARMLVRLLELVEED